MSYNKAMIAFFAVYILKVPLAIILYVNGNYLGVLYTVLLGLALEVFLFFYANTRPFGS